MTALPLDSSSEEPLFRNAKLVAEYEFAVASYRRRYRSIRSAPDLIRRHWRQVEALLVEQLRRPCAPEQPDRPAPCIPAEAIPHQGSRSVYDIRDVPAFCRRILDTELRRRGQSFQSGHYSYDDALSDLVCAVYRLAARYDPARTRSFRLYATFKLAHHAVPDIGRSLLGRNGNRAAELAHVEVDDRADTGRRPWDATSAREGDPSELGGWLGEGVEAEGDRGRDRRATLLRLQANRRA